MTDRRTMTLTANGQTIAERTFPGVPGVFTATLTPDESMALHRATNGSVVVPIVISVNIPEETNQ